MILKKCFFFFNQFLLLILEINHKCTFYRLRSAKVLLIGLGGFGAEIAKNVILAGVKSITLLDHRNVTIEDTCSQFFIPNDQIGKNVCKFFY